MEKNNLFLTLQQVTVRHLDKTIFRDLDFHVEYGQHWALVGESGSGKSALLQAVAGNLNIVHGKVCYPFYDNYLQEHSIKDPLFTHNKLISIVPQKANFRNLSNTTEFYYQQRYNSSDSEDALTVRQYLRSIEPENISNPVWNFDHTIDRLKLGSLLDKQLIKLSNGETKRLLIAAALLKHPLLLLLDSPFTGLDADTRPLLQDMMHEIRDSGIHLLMATSPKEIPDAFTSVAVLHEGQIIDRMRLSDFQPSRVAIPQSTPPDEQELKLLLHNKGREEYHQIVAMENVSVKYGDQQILEGVNWQINPGEGWALVGPNGAGKSTLLSLINGDNPQAYANHIVLFDKRRGSGESIWDIKKKIGFVSPELLQYFKTGSNCLQVVESGLYDTMGLFRPSSPKNADTARRWMKILEIEEYASKLFAKIPASTQRLCLLARALIKNPPLLILDEPCQGLDHHQQQHFKELVNAICQHSRTSLIYVSHYAEEIPEFVTKVLRLEKGKVVS